MEALLSLLLAVVLIGFMSTSDGYDFAVGGGSGWVESPSEGYGNWAERNRFQIGDSLVFKYKKGDDSVLVVTKEAFDSCNVSNPIQRLDGGDSVFKFDRSGLFFFISGTAGHCDKGQKLVVIVLAPRNPNPSPSPVSSPPSLPPTPTSFPKPPNSSPAPSPISSPLSPSPSPISSPSSPSPSPSPTSHISSPSTSPSPSPSPSSLSPSPAAATPATPPAVAVSPSQPPTSASPPSGSPSGIGSAPAPPPASSSSSILTASGVSFGLVALVLGGTYLG